MKNLSIVCCFCLLNFFVACSSNSKRDISSIAAGTTPSRLASLQSLIEENAIWRDEAQKDIEAIDSLVKRRGDLKTKEIEQIMAHVEKYLDFYDRFKQEVAEDLIFVNSSDIYKLPAKGTEREEYDYHYKRLSAGELTIFDNYINIFLLLEENRYLRLLAKWNNVQVKTRLQKHLQQVNGPEYRNFVWELSKGFYQNEKKISKKNISYPAHLQQDFLFLDHVVRETAAVSVLNSSKKTFLMNYHMVMRSISDAIERGKNAGMGVWSKIFGNTVGKVEKRKGKLINMPIIEQDSIAETLQPLDILAERTPFRLTSKFIPGYYGHIAIWVGTEEQLKELGVWDHPAVVPYQQAVREGLHIIEALRTGVEINTLEHFLNIDDFLALRIKSPLSPEQKRDYLIRAFEQIGKEYDFNFDVETEDRIVCSELAYVVYDEINWSTEKILGRATISPDNVVVEGIPNGTFYPVIMYRDGNRITENISDELVRALESRKKN